MQNARISPARAQQIALIAAAVTVVGHLVANPHYGFFRDELYFIVCGRHPAFGYVDQPPLVPLAAALSQVFGTSLFLLRAVPALCAGAAVWASCMLAAELGGGAFALVLTAIAVALAPVLAAFGAKLSTDSDMLWTWPLAALFAVRAVLREDGRWWLGAGAALGIASESKYSVLFFAFALFVGLVLSPQRRWLRSKWFWYGVALGCAIALPSILWQALHHFPMVELLRNGQHGKNVVLGPAQYLWQEIALTAPLLAPIWIIGLIALLRRDGRVEWLGYAFIVLIVTMIALHGKNYYPGAVYSIVFAAGSVTIEQWTARIPTLRPAVAALAVAGGALMLPFVEPILPEQDYIAYVRALHVHPVESEHQRQGLLSQDFADMHGWEDLTAAVAHVYDGLPAPRGHVAIIASNYGEAAAIDVFGVKLGLPHAISGHNQYFLWGPGDADGRYIIDLNGDVSADRRFCAQAWVAATVSARYAMPYERDLPIVVCHGLRMPLAQIWPRQKVYI